MVSINKVQLLGNLTKDPEIKETANGKLARLSLATNRRYRDREGQMQDAAQYHDIVVFQERLVEVIESYCEKGTQIFVEGSLEHRSYDDRDGNRKYVSEVVIRPYGGDLQLGNRAQGSEGGSGGSSGGGRGRDDDRSGSRGGNRDNDNRGRDDDRGGSRGGNDNRGGGSKYDDMDDDIPF
tara:strand:+ start:474 stop:1013 length:540 start_codon:yes stop_codon:yes gene_type:complete